MTEYIIYWLNSPPEIMEGSTIAEAFTNAGYSAGAVKAVDWYEEVGE